MGKLKYIYKPIPNFTCTTKKGYRGTLKTMIGKKYSPVVNQMKTSQIALINMKMLFLKQSSKKQQNEAGISEFRKVLRSAIIFIKGHTRV
jgi:hypothetical protein